MQRRDASGCSGMTQEQGDMHRMGRKKNARAIHTGHTPAAAPYTLLATRVSQSSFAFLFSGKHKIVAGSSFYASLKTRMRNLTETHVRPEVCKLSLVPPLSVETCIFIMGLSLIQWFRSVENKTGKKGQKKNRDEKILRNFFSFDNNNLFFFFRQQTT
jgi:hypothetical protein